jgi:uncharacterized protein YbjT (DUF2867 family)
LNNKSALLIGASGLVGGNCLNFLLSDSYYNKVIILLRKLLPVKNEKLEQHIIDFDNLDNYLHLINANDIFCCLGTTIKKAGSQESFRKVDFDYPYKIAKIASGNSSQQFLIITALGANPKSSIFYNRVKGEVEEEIKKLSFNGIHIFRPSLLLGNRQESRIGEKVGIIMSKMVSPILIGSLKKYKPVETKAVAFSMIEIAKRNLTGVNVFESDLIQSIYDKK